MTVTDWLASLDLTLIAMVTAVALGFGAVAGAGLCIFRILHWI